MNAHGRSRAIRRGMAQAAKQGRKPGRRPRDLDLDLIRQRIRNGESMRSVATALGLSHSLISRRLKHSFEDEVFG